MPNPTWTLLDEGCHPHVGGARNYVTEIWGTEDLDAAQLGNNPTDIKTLIDTCPPQYGQPHPDGGLVGALVRWKECIYGPTRNRAKVAVFYDSAVNFRLGNYLSRGREGDSNLEAHRVPVCTPFTCNWIAYGHRVFSTKIVNVFSGSFDPDKIQHTIMENSGAWYFFRTTNGLAMPDFSVSGDVIPEEGFPALLAGGYTQDTGTGLIKVVYRFMTKGKTLPILGSDIGSVYDLPALGYLGEYKVDPTDSYRPRGVAFHKLYPRGANLPTGNVFNPIR